MTQPNNLEQAKQGQPSAIAALMNSQLQAKGIQVKARRKEDYLQMRFLSSKVPQEDKLAPWVHRGLERLHPHGVERVQIEGWKVGASRPAWVQTLTLAPSGGDSEAVQAPELSQPRDVAQEDTSGDCEAIAIGINEVLSPQQLTAQVRLRDRVLIVTVSGQTAPQAQRLKTALQPQIEAQRGQVCDRVLLEGKAAAEESITWSQDWDEISLSAPSQSWHSRLRNPTPLVIAIAGSIILIIVLVVLFLVN